MTSFKQKVLTLGYGVAAFLLFAILLTAELWSQPTALGPPLQQQINAALRDPATQWLILLALAGYFILFCILGHRLAVRGRWWHPGNADLWLSAVFALALIRFPFSSDKATGFSYVSTFLAGVVFGKAVSTLALWRRPRLEPNTRWLAFGLICFLASAALWQPARGMTIRYHEIVRWSGMWRNPNYYGLLMGAGLVLAAGMGIRKWRLTDGKRRKIIRTVVFFAAALLCGFGVFKSYSRGTWLGVMMAFAFLAVQTCRSLPAFVWLRRNRWTLMLLLTALLLLAFWQFRFSEWTPAQRVFSVANINDFSWRNRVAAWERAFQTMVAHPLAGAGWTRLLLTNWPNYSPPQSAGSAIATNDFLVLGTSAGVPVLLSFAVYLALAFRAKPVVPTVPPSIFTICRASSIIFLIGSWLDGGLFILAVTMVFWMLMELSRLESAVLMPPRVADEPPPLVLQEIPGGESAIPAGLVESPTATTHPEADNESKTASSGSRSKGEIWLRRTAFVLAVIAAMQTAVYVGTLFSPVSQTTLSIGRKCLIPSRDRDDLDYLASNPNWAGRRMSVLLEHVDLANYNRRLVNWKLDEATYRDFVLTPAIQPDYDGELRWRRPLWEFFYPGIRKQNRELDAAKFVLQQLRHAVDISSDAPATIEEMWQEKTADAKGFEALSVAAFRAVGIPARLGGNGRSEFFDGKTWKPASSLAN
jgi:hypothetical protein